jgi:predicted dinucleotide-utilizing enzyme
MSQNEIVYLKYQNLEDMLKVIIYSAQSMLGVIPMLYYIPYNNDHVLFIQTGAIGGVTVEKAFWGIYVRR